MFFLHRWTLKRKVEKALAIYFPGTKFKFIIHPDDSWDCDLVAGKREFCELYPSMTKEQADQQALLDMVGIIREYVPWAEPEWYERDGLHYFRSEVVKE